MRNGSFNKIYKIGNMVIKINKDKNTFSKLIMKEMDNKKYKRYQKDLNKIGIKTSKIYFNICNIIFIEKYIKGKTLQEIIEDTKISLNKKISLLKKFLKVYKRTLNTNICIDCNMQNFIINKNDIYYIDFVPSLYRNKINEVNNNFLKDYKQLYIDTKLQLLNIINYVIKSMFYLDINKLKEFKNNLINYIEKNFRITLDFNYNNITLKKFDLINKYIEGYISKEDFDKEYKKINKR